MPDVRTILVTGATGFVGGRLITALRERDFEVVGTSRHPDRAAAKQPGIEFRHLDVTRPASIDAALEGCDAAVYLVHSMSDSDDYDAVERRAARDFARAAERQGLRRVVYLGGVEPQQEPSRHLRSRLETGRILREGAVSTVELRAAMIIGGGSQSFRIVRDLATRLPFMILPKWLDNASEPIAIDDVIAALCHALTVEVEGSPAYDIPGPEVLSGKEILERTAALIGPPPKTIRVPLVTPKLSSYWIQLVTRVDGRLADQLVAGLGSGLVSQGPRYWQFMPEHELVPFDTAARRALTEEEATLGPRTRQAESLLRRLIARGHPAST